VDTRGRGCNTRRLGHCKPFQMSDGTRSTNKVESRFSIVEAGRGFRPGRKRVPALKDRFGNSLPMLVGPAEELNRSDVRPRGGTRGGDSKTTDGTIKLHQNVFPFCQFHFKSRRLWRLVTVGCGCRLAREWGVHSAQTVKVLKPTRTRRHSVKKKNVC